MRRARDRLVAAQGGLTRADRADLCAGFQAAVAETLAEKTRRRLPPPSAAATPARARAGRRRRRRRQRRDPRGAGGGGRRRGLRLPRAAARALHRQRRDHRLGRRRAHGGARTRRPDALRPPALAARRRRRRRCSAPAAREPRRDRGARRRRLRHRARRGCRPPKAAAVRLWGRDAAAMAAAERRPRDPPPARRRPAAEPRLHRRPRRAGRRRGRAAGACRRRRPKASSPPTAPRCRPRRWCSAPRASTPAGFRLQTEIAAAARPGRALAALTGPGFAGEIARGLPTALTLACADPDLGRALQAGLATRRLRLYLTDDLIGAQLGGALKNVVAIACGMVEGARPRRLGPRGADDPRLRRDDPPRRGDGRAPRDAGRPLRPRRPVAHLQLGPVAQLRARPRARRRRGPPRRHRRGGCDGARRLPAWRGAQGVELPIAAAVADVLDGAGDARRRDGGAARPARCARNDGEALDDEPLAVQVRSRDLELGRPGRQGRRRPGMGRRAQLPGAQPHEGDEAWATSASSITPATSRRWSASSR